MANGEWRRYPPMLLSIRYSLLAIRPPIRHSTPAERIVALVFPVAALVVVGDFHRDHVFRILESELGRRPETSNTWPVYRRRPASGNRAAACRSSCRSRSSPRRRYGG